jgi:hypothetical protein
MKVNIGQYKSWIGPYQIAEKIIFWADKYECTPWGERQHKLGTWLAEDKHGDDSWLLKFCNWIESKRSRQMYVRIDNYDTWSMDHTLAYIILPMLKQLKATKHGAPRVDDSDVPVPIRSTAPGAQDRCEEDYDTDEHFFTRWDWVLDEMIWAFEQKTDGDSEAQFYNHGTKIKGEDLMQSIQRIKVDYDGLKAHNARKNNGFRLFGKYYEALWD